MSESIGLQGRHVRLVPLDFDSHFDNTLRWLSDPAVTRHLQQNLPITRLREDAYFRKMMQSQTDAIWAILAPDGQHIGNTTIQDINWKERLATCGTLIGDHASHGRGYGLDAGLVKLKYAFEELGLNRLEAEVFAENTACCKVCEKAGWIQEGTARKKYFRRGQWHDVIRYAIIADDYYSG